jgi:hypothetical protein
VARVSLFNGQDDHHCEQTQGCSRQDLPIADVCPATQGENRYQADNEEKGMVVAWIAHASRP